MIELNEIYKSIPRAQSLIDACEKNFQQNIARVSDAIISCDNLRIVTLCGPTCSGKTTTASILTADLEKSGKKARVLSIDDFYYSRDEMLHRGIRDFEGPDAIDLDLLKSCLQKLAANKKVCLPTFDFTSGCRIAMTEYIPDKNDIYILEGIQAMYPEVMDMLADFNYKGIYISVSRTLNVCGKRFTKEDLRLLRRIVRDHYHRGTSAEQTMKLWPAVRKNEEKNIYPNINKADFRINSLMPYEVLLLGKFFMEITEGYPMSTQGSAVIYAMRARIEPLCDNCITADMIPEKSVFREFIV